MHPTPAFWSQSIGKPPVDCAFRRVSLIRWVSGDGQKIYGVLANLVAKVVIEASLTRIEVEIAVISSVPYGVVPRETGYCEGCRREPPQPKGNGVEYHQVILGEAIGDGIVVVDEAGIHLSVDGAISSKAHLAVPQREQQRG